MKLKHLQIDGFKSLAGFNLELSSNLSVLLGVNGAGKSSALQAIDMIAAFARGEIKDFLSRRGWALEELRSHALQPNHRVHVKAQFEFENDYIDWEFSLSLITGRNRREKIEVLSNGNLQSIEYDGKLLHYPFSEEGSNTETESSVLAIAPRGSILSIIDSNSFGKKSTLSIAIRSLIAWAEGVFPLDLLSPASMRSGARGVPTHIGQWGEHLSSFIANLKPPQREKLLQRLGQLYPVLKALDTKKKKAGWVDLKIAETFRGFRAMSPGQVSDGFLRLLAFSCIPEFHESVKMVLLDEVENGIEPHLLSIVVEILNVESGRQIVATSHSPLIINLIDASQVNVLARDRRGRTKAASLSRVLNSLNHSDFSSPGETWLNASAKTFYSQVVKTAKTIEAPTEKS